MHTPTNTVDQACSCSQKGQVNVCSHSTQTHNYMFAETSACTNRGPVLTAGLEAASIHGGAEPTLPPFLKVPILRPDSKCVCSDVGRCLTSDAQMGWASPQRREGVPNPGGRRPLALAKERWNGTCNLALLYSDVYTAVLNVGVGQGLLAPI